MFKHKLYNILNDLELYSNNTSYVCAVEDRLNNSLITYAKELEKTQKYLEGKSVDTSIRSLSKLILK